MLHKLDFTVAFTHTKKQITGSHDFQKGLSAITGPNESGKSMRLEMIRFALWGSKALRTKASDYDKINVALSFTVGDHLYNVVRQKHNATLDCDNHQMVTGTSPVNAAIEKIFGYNMDVFDIANACLQGEVEALSRMTNTERKRMVDKVIGLDTLDDLIKEVASEQSAQKAILDTLHRNPSANFNLELPEMPQGYSMSAAELETFEQSTMQQVMEKNKIESTIMALNCDRPGDKPVVEGPSLNELYTEKAKADGARYQISLLEEKKVRLKPSGITSPFTIEELEEYISKGVDEQWSVYQQYLNKKIQLETSLPQYSFTEIQFFKKILDLKPFILKLQDLETNGSMIVCDKCENKIYLSQAEIDKLVEEIEKRSSIKGKKDFEQELCSLNEAGYEHDYQIQEDLSRWKEYHEFISGPELSEPETPKRENVTTTLQLLKKDQEILSVQKELVDEITLLKAQLGVMAEVDFDKKISIRAEQESKLRQWEANTQKWEKFQGYIEETKDWLKNLGNVEEDLRMYREKRVLARDYESALRDYAVRKEQHDQIHLQLEEAQEKLKTLTNVRKALNDLKPKIKLYLVPSLNRVASNLLSQMTNGQRNVIDVNEEFDIWVDNQPIDTLSGSGKAVANLAIRIGLGTVLTNKVFSVLLADEVDAAMDKDRAAFTAECLRGLTETFSQIILVSHQKPQADHQIEL